MAAYLRLERKKSLFTHAAANHSSSISRESPWPSLLDILPAKNQVKHLEKCAQLHEQTHTLGQCLVSFHLLKSKSSVDTMKRTLLRIMFITHKKSDRLPVQQAHADQRRVRCLRLGTFQIEYQKHLRKKHINLRLMVVVCPTVYMVLSIPNDAEFQPSTTSIFVTSTTLEKAFLRGLRVICSAHHERTCGHLYKLHQDTWVCHTKNQHKTG